MPRPDTLAELADTIAPDRARQLSAEFGPLPCRDLAVLLGTAFPALTPTADWQRAVLDELAREGWRTARRRSDVVERLRRSVRLDPAPREADFGRFRQVIWREKVRIALRELLPHYMGGMGIDVTGRELSHLADAAFEVALDVANQQTTRRFGEPRRSDGGLSCLVMLGMGKLGGQELNPGSDVDVIFIYDSDEGGSQLSLHEHWARVVRRAVEIISQLTEYGLVWRVDLRLRPEGSQGPIVNSVAAAERYYETWGRLWERAALLRARPSAGDQELGALLAREVLTPFVFRREVEPRVAIALAELVERARDELSEAPARDLKLGPGGIREAEFFVQSLQLIWGGLEPSIRVPGLLDALARLSFRGLVSDREAREIAVAYELLRRCEHRLQWIRGLQTHVLPNDIAFLRHLARTLGMPDEEMLRQELDRARSIVRELFASLLPEAPPAAARHRGLLRCLERGEKPPQDELEEPLRDPEIIDHLVALSRRPDDLLGTHTHERFPDLADRALEAIAESPDPRQAARSLRVLFGRLASPDAYVALLARDAQFLRRLVTVLGASMFVAESLVARPDMADVFLVGTAHLEAPRQLMRDELEVAMRSLPEDADAYERQDRFLQATRQVKHALTMAVAVADLAGSIQTREATHLLSELAEETLQQAVRHEMGGEPRGLAVIAMGKLGGREVGYGSDLDVIFIYEPDAAPPGAEPSEHFIRLAQRIIRLITEPHLAGRGYELDTRLRPSGSHGLLVTSLRSFARYHNLPFPDDAADEPAPSVLSSGAAWERQALLRARACAGDLELGTRVIQIAEVAAYERGAAPAKEIHHLRMRMERELGREHPPREYDLKTGRGGLLDVEFAVQWLQMRHGGSPEVRTTDTGEALAALRAQGHLEPHDHSILRDAYEFLRRLEQRIHVLRGTGSTKIAVDAPGLWQLARRMGLRDTARASAVERLMSRYQQVTETVRATYLAILGLDE